MSDDVNPVVFRPEALDAGVADAVAMIRKTLTELWQTAPEPASDDDKLRALQLTLSNSIANGWWTVVLASRELPEFAELKADDDVYWGSVFEALGMLLARSLSDTYCCQQHLVSDAAGILNDGIAKAFELVSMKGQPPNGTRH